MGHQLTGRWLIDSIEQCRGAARAAVVPEVKGFSAAVGDKAEGDAHARFGGNFMFRAGAKTGQEIQRSRLQTGLFAAWLVVLHAELEGIDTPVFPEFGGKVERATDRQGVGAIEFYKVLLFEQIIGRKLGVFDQQFGEFGFQLGCVPALLLEVFDGFGNPQDIRADFADMLLSLLQAPLFVSQLSVSCHVFGVSGVVRILGTQLVHALVYFINFKLHYSFLSLPTAGLEIRGVAFPVIKRGKPADSDLHQYLVVWQRGTTIAPPPDCRGGLASRIECRWLSLLVIPGQVRGHGKLHTAEALGLPAGWQGSIRAVGPDGWSHQR